MKQILLYTLPLYLYASSSFITPSEYAAQLYKNPRGIGCDKCHGENGEGKLIARYKHKGVEKSFRGPRINNKDYREFFNALNKRNRGMPRYFLTTKEIEALYLHLHKDEEEKRRADANKTTTAL